MEFCGKLDPKKFADIVKLVAIHCPHNIIIVENTGGYGQTVISELIYDEEVEYNLFGDWINRSSPNSVSRGRGRRSKTRKEFIPGLNTNSKTRPLILDALFDYVKTDPDMIHSERLSMELLGLVNKSNRIEADTGFHDDLAMAYGFCCYVRKYCPDSLGDLEALPDVEAQSIFTEKSIQTFRGLNGDAPLLGYRVFAESNEETPAFRDEVDKYVQESILKGDFCGFVNVMDLFTSQN